MDIKSLLELKERIDMQNLYSEKITSEDKLENFLNSNNLSDKIDSEERNMFIEYSKAEDSNVIKNYIAKNIEKISDEEKIQTSIVWSCFKKNESLRKGDSNRDIIDLVISSVQDKNKILDKFEDFFYTEFGRTTLNNIDDRLLSEYIKNNYDKNEGIVNYTLVRKNALEILGTIDDINKAIITMQYLLPSNDYIKNNYIPRKSMFYKEDGFIMDAESELSKFRENFLFKIKDKFCRRQIILCFSKDRKADVAEFKKILQEYKEIDAKINSITDEKEKTDFITNLEDNELKVLYLKEIKSKLNKKSVIESLNKNIDPRIEGYANLTQKMIKEFFEDKMGEKLTEAQKEKLDAVFAKTSVNYDDLEMSINGCAYNYDNLISLSTRHLSNPNKSIMYLLHEYGHILSQQNMKYDNYHPNHDIEEGMQDVFSELVINHYIEKHGKIELNGKKIRMEYPVKVISSYDKENSWTRTLLYSMKLQERDAEAITEYQLGDKNKFLELAIGKDNADTKSTDLYGNKHIHLSLHELYNQMPDGFENIDINSTVYGRKNEFLPVFILQKRLENTKVNFLGLELGKKYLCNYVAEQYFQGEKLYEIPYKDFLEFSDLYDAQNNRFICDYDDFADNMLNKLTEEEIETHSMEILDNGYVLARNLNTMSENSEKVFRIALMKEMQNVEQGQAVKESAVKYKKIINNYMNALSGVKNDSGEFLMDNVKDLRDAYLQQMEENIKNGNVQEILEGLKNNNDDTIYTDKAILQLFEDNGVKFEQMQIMGTSYKSQNIIDATLRAKIKLDDVKKMSILLKEQDRDKDYIGERVDE